MKACLLLLLPAALWCAEPGIRGFDAASAGSQRELESRARAIPSAERIREYMRRMSDQPHHAGSPASRQVAEYLAALLRGWGWGTTIEEFEALLPAPKSRLLQLLEPRKFTAKLEEPRIPEDKASGDAGQLPTYNAYGAAADVTAPLVYVNYGVPDDYERLRKLSIDVKGKIVIARYGGSWRGVKPKVAWENGAIGCIIYSDPKEDGYFAGDVYPKGGWRPKDGVQRGSVLDMAIYPGDPLSPGWASEKGSRRLPLSEAKTLPKIPVLPISYSDAQPLLEGLGGPVAPVEWRGALPITYHVGPGDAKVRLAVDIDWSTGPLYNVIARMKGAEFPDQWVLYGNHHDAWVNGASDPASGAAPLLETARALAELSRQGWKPKRSILLTLWDGEEFGLIGSTEWAEKHAEVLGKQAVAYFNTDMNLRGRFSAAGSHTLERFMSEIIRDVLKPEQFPKTGDQPGDRPIDQPGEFRLGPLGSGSDYTAFIHHLGIASVNFGFSDGAAAGVYHSIYDSYDWYTHFADTDFRSGKSLSEVSATMLLRMAEAPLLPFEFSGFGRAVGEYVQELKKLKGSSRLNLREVQRELAALDAAGRSFEIRYQRAVERASSARPDELAKANEILYLSERAMLDDKGLPGRDWFRHQIYAPGLYTGYGAKTLPGIREAAEGGRWDEANRQAGAVAAALRAVRRKISEAGRVLRW